MEHTAIPVTVLSGFLGSGKTTLLNQLLQNAVGLRLAVIVNDMSEVNIDAALVRGSEATMLRSEEQLVEMSNGCICCTLREDLLREVAKLAHTGQFDGIIIESTGIAEPLPVAETFTFQNETGTRLMDVARLDTLVTAVDCAQFLDNFTSGSTLADQKIGIDADDARGIAALLTDQIEFANVIVLTKTDLVTPETVRQVQAVISRLNPTARVLMAVNGNVPPSELFATGRFTLAEAEQDAKWLQEERGAHTPETEEYGISSFVFSAKRPFDHAKLMRLLRSDRLSGVIRSKGFIWTNKQPEVALYWSHAGKILGIEPKGLWPKRNGEIQGEQQLVLIGIHLDRQQVEQELTSALVSC